MNLAMSEKLRKLEAIDVNVIGTKIGNGDWKLPRFTEGVDYCDAEGERWIWSIGVNNMTGEIFASTTTSYYEQPGWTCLWLR